MAKLVLRKYPKKPKSSASAAAIQSYFARCKEVDAENAKRKRDHSDREALVRKLKSFKPGKTKASGTKRRKSTGKKRTAKKRK